MQLEFAPKTKLATIAAAFGLTSNQMIEGRNEGLIEVRKFPNGTMTVEVAASLLSLAASGNTCGVVRLSNASPPSAFRFTTPTSTAPTSNAAFRIPQKKGH